jgi:hypothetical protein
MAAITDDIPTLPRIQETFQKGRKDCKYTVEERKVIGKYKNEYKKATNRAERAMLMKNKILVDIFNYWYSQGLELDEGESEKRIKVFVLP